MKRIIPVILCALICLSCEREDLAIDYDEIELDAYIIENYTYDAKQLYFHEIIKGFIKLEYSE